MFGHDYHCFLRPFQTNICGMYILHTLKHQKGLGNTKGTQQKNWVNHWISDY